MRYQIAPNVCYRSWYDLGPPWLFVWSIECIHSLVTRDIKPPTFPHSSHPSTSLHAPLMILQILLKTLKNQANHNDSPTLLLVQIIHGYYQAYVRKLSMMIWIFQSCISQNPKYGNLISFHYLITWYNYIKLSFLIYVAHKKHA